MVCANTGIASLTPHGKSISLFNCFVSIACGVLGVIGCVSYTLQEGPIRVAPWSILDMHWTKTGGSPPITGSTGMHTFMYGGLKGGQLFVATPGEKDFYTEPPLAYADCMTYPPPTGGKYYSFCEACDKGSAAIVSMCSLALIAAFVGFFCHLLRATCDSAFAKDMSVLAGLSSFVFGIVGLVIALPCKTAFDDWITIPTTVNPYTVKLLSETFKLDYSVGFGAGAKVVIASFAMIFVITLLSLLTPVAQAPEPVPTTEVTKV